MMRLFCILSRHLDSHCRKIKRIAVLVLAWVLIICSWIVSCKFRCHAHILTIFIVFKYLSTKRKKTLSVSTSLKRTSDNNPGFGDATTCDILCIKNVTNRTSSDAVKPICVEIRKQGINIPYELSCNFLRI